MPRSVTRWGIATPMIVSLRMTTNEAARSSQMTRELRAPCRPRRRCGGRARVVSGSPCDGGLALGQVGYGAFGHGSGIQSMSAQSCAGGCASNVMSQPAPARHYSRFDESIGTYGNVAARCGLRQTARSGPVGRRGVGKPALEELLFGSDLVVDPLRRRPRGRVVVGGNGGGDRSWLHDSAHRRHRPGDRCRGLRDLVGGGLGAQREAHRGLRELGAGRRSR